MGHSVLRELRWIHRMVAALAVIGGWCGLASQASASSFWGVGATGVLAQAPGLEATELATTRSLGITLARFGVYVDADAQMAALASQGIEPYPMLSGNYGAFAARYGVGGSFWTATVDPVHIYEIGNEPNVRTLPQDYAATFRAADQQILAQDPTAYVVAGGLAAMYPPYHFDVYDWTRQMITALGYCPVAIGYHAYASTLGQLETGLQNERTALNDVSCPMTNIELNEFLMVGSDPATLSAAMTWIAHSNIGVSRVILYMWYANPVPSRGFFPTMTLDGTLTPTGVAFIDTIRSLAAESSSPGIPPAEVSPIATSPQGPISSGPSTKRRHHRRRHHRRRLHGTRRRHATRSRPGTWLSPDSWRPPDGWPPADSWPWPAAG